MKWFKKTHRLEIVFKSGKSIIVKCDDWKIKDSGGELVSYSFTGLKGKKPIFIRIADVSSIIQLN